jgi:hypothetical protein
MYMHQQQLLEGVLWSVRNKLRRQRLLPARVE